MDYGDKLPPSPRCIFRPPRGYIFTPRLTVSMPNDYQALNAYMEIEPVAMLRNTRNHGVHPASEAHIVFSAYTTQRSYRMFRFAMGVICFLLLAGVTGPTAAKNCSSAEKRQANEVLERIENDQLLRDELIALHVPFGIHTSTSDTDGEDILVQGGYIMAHDQDLRTSIWVTYRLTRKDIEGAVGKKRVNCFRKDPRFARGEGASTSDYREPTYDQGHLANDADLKDDFIQQLNSYVMSNMSPQECRFNRGIWLSLEHLTRILAGAYGEIFVISGAIFDQEKPSGRDPDEQAQRMRSNSGKMRVGVPSLCAAVTN